MMPSRHQKSVTTGQLDWPRGHSSGGEGVGGRPGDSRGASQPKGGGVQEVGGAEALQRRLRIDVNSPVSPITCVCVPVCLPVLVDLGWLPLTVHAALTELFHRQQPACDFAASGVEASILQRQVLKPRFCSVRC